MEMSSIHRSFWMSSLKVSLVTLSTHKMRSVVPVSGRGSTLFLYGNQVVSWKLNVFQFSRNDCPVEVPVGRVPRRCQYLTPVWVNFPSESRRPSMNYHRRTRKSGLSTTTFLCRSTNSTSTGLTAVGRNTAPIRRCTVRDMGVSRRRQP
jgi:hypothetical protein